MVLMLVAIGVVGGNSLGADLRYLDQRASGHAIPQRRSNACFAVFMAIASARLWLEAGGQ